MWILRRFGFLAMMVAPVVWMTGASFPLTITSWMAGRSIAYHLVPVIVAAWALWVIASQKRGLSTERI
jgi:hypothetical protein